MNRNRAIQKSTTIFLLLVFTISSAPKTFFHDLIAGHKDFSDCRQLHHSTVLHHKGINCHFDDLVVTAPFLSLTEQPVVFVDFCFEKKLPAFYSSSQQSFLQHKENRGPPKI